ncbi:CoA ester lyase [Devosia algicola]|uniref:CoA ester lyase n=1 Tax=Devosia algicola TaxID=3026418 RepID=A0ABY7YM91_9HYPH|nr:CoA ester lyase [Devosia algicola]WDR02200.1 CoA ester lyase [Devosia algicola]
MIRSLLYVPAHSERFLAKAHQRGADAIILDLEDSVPPEHKSAARDGLAASVVLARSGGAKVFVRINPGSDDDARAACRARADGLLLPKVQRPETLVDLATLLEPVENECARPAMQFVALLESPGAVLNAAAIARAPRLLGLALGGEDLALTLGAQPTPAVLHLPKLLVHYAAKAQGLLSFGLLRSVADYADLDAIKMAVQEAQEHGFDGATCVHPGVVPHLNAGFLPSSEQLDWATRVLAKADHQQGSFSLDGRMVDAPIVARARSIASRARQDDS